MREDKYFMQIEFLNVMVGETQVLIKLNHIVSELLIVF